MSIDLPPPTNDDHFGANRGVGIDRNDPLLGGYNGDPTPADTASTKPEALTDLEYNKIKAQIEAQKLEDVRKGMQAYKDAFGSRDLF
jgi:hypothetical protein